MKKIICLLLCFVITVCFVGCNNDNPDKKSESSAEAQTDTLSADENEIDIDLTEMSGTMVYSEVYNMTNSPSDYTGKRVKMSGKFSVYTDKETGKNYFACLIADATACCSQGIEFLLKDEKKYPDEYPELGTEITVVGTFGTYYEGKSRYCQLKNADMTT